MSGGSSWTTSVGRGRAGDRLGPPVEPLGHLGAGGDGRRERRAVEAGDERPRPTSAAVRVTGGGAGQLELPAGLAGDGVDHGAEHLEGDGRGRRRGRARRPGRAWRRPARSSSASSTQGRRPAHVEVHGACRRRAAWCRQASGTTRALGHEAHGGDGHPAQPARRWRRRRSSPRPPPTATQPAERLLDGDRQGRGPERRSGRATSACTAPAERRAADGLEAVGQLVVVGGRRRRGRRPTPRSEPAAHDAWSRTSPAGSAAAMRHVGRRSAGAGEQVVGRLEAGQLGLEVGHHLGALGPLELADGVEVVLGVVDQPLEGATPPGPIGLQPGPLLVGGVPVAAAQAAASSARVASSMCDRRSPRRPRLNHLMWTDFRSLTSRWDPDVDPHHRRRRDVRLRPPYRLHPPVRGTPPPRSGSGIAARTPLGRRRGPDGGQAAESVRAATSSGVSSIVTASMFSSRWSTEPVPGMGSICDERASSQASTT